MSNRKALRRLSRTVPASPEIKQIMSDLRQQSDISVAITATAILEASLEKLITSRLKSKRSELLEQLFQNMGPLSDFHSKILVAEAFGFITPNTATELHTIKVIRNAFAHSKVPLDFDNSLLTTEVHSFQTLQALKNTDSKTMMKMSLATKSWFFLMVELCLIVLDYLAEHNITPAQLQKEIEEYGIDKA